MPVEPITKCSNMTESVRFYTEVLDFGISQPPDPDPTAFMSKYAELIRDGDVLHLSAHAADGVFGGAIYVRVDNLDELFELFVSRGLNTTEKNNLPALRMAAVEQTWGMKEFSVSDPDGNRITFGQPINNA